MSPTTSCSSIWQREYGFQIIGYIEPKPGIPPSAAHIESLIEEMKGSKPDGILVTPPIRQERGGIALRRRPG